MAKDYFQDITPPFDEEPSREPAQRPPQQEAPEPAAAPQRGIRNISMPSRGRRPAADMHVPPRPAAAGAPRQPRKRRSWYLWGAAGILLLIIALLASFAFRPTTITVVPKTHPLLFNDASKFTAYPQGLAATGTLAYTVKTLDLEDSEVVQADGTTTLPAAKASGSITIYNDYADTPLHLVKNTRFETPDGLVFRMPSDVVVPGKKGSTPGSVTVQVQADAAGEQYNVGPVSRFTLPGLASSPAMHDAVYGRSTAAMTGGSSGGQGPYVAPAALQAAISTVRARLQAKAEDAAKALSTDSTVAFPGMMQTSFRDMPRTNETGSGVRIHESVHVMVPVFAEPDFASAIAQLVSADASGDAVVLRPGTGFDAAITSSSTPTLGSDPIVFVLAGQADLIWRVDAAGLAEALAGRSADAFQAIVDGFPGVDEAHARIEPFWKSTFPTDPKAIRVNVETPDATS